MSEGMPFGPYFLIKRLAVGGMAEVFLARTRGEGATPRLVVVKRMLPILAEDPEISRMLLDEARIAAQLAHPFLTQVFDVGRLDKTFYIAMDYVHGVNLKDLLEAAAARDQPMPWTLAVRLASYLCEVLEYVHELKSISGEHLQLVHRDISPSNIMVTYVGAPKLVDFGIARASQRLGHTQPGVIKGKLLYAAPEQYDNRGVDARTDIYGLALCLYEMLTGKNPFWKAPSPLHAATAVAKEVPPSVLSVRPDVPRKLAEAIAAALEKDPAKRPQTAGELRKRLEASLGEAHAVVGMPELGRWLAQLYPGRGALDRSRDLEATPDAATVRVAPEDAAQATFSLRGATPKPPPVDSVPAGPPPLPTQPEVPHVAGPPVLMPATALSPQAAPGQSPMVSPAPVFTAPKVVTPPLVSPPISASPLATAEPMRRPVRWPRRLLAALIVVGALGASAYGAVVLRRTLEAASTQKHP